VPVLGQPYFDRSDSLMTYPGKVCLGFLRLCMWGSMMTRYVVVVVTHRDKGRDLRSRPAGKVNIETGI